MEGEKMKITRKVETMIELTKDEVEYAIIDALPKHLGDRWFQVHLNLDGSAVVKKEDKK